MVSEKDGGWRISCVVRNTGKVAGKEAVQLYVAAPGKKLAKPARELKAFTKARLLQPGESQEVLFQIDSYAQASYDESRSDWVTEVASYEAMIGAPSRDLKAKALFKVTAEKEFQTGDFLRPIEKISILR